MTATFTPLLNHLRLDNSFIEQLPGDPDLSPARRQVNGACYSFVKPMAVNDARLIAVSEAMATELGFSRQQWHSQAFLDLFSGNDIPAPLKPYAQCYGGHQFGHWAGQLGDGRAINLAEVVAPDGRHWILQLKGAGPTPYSRTADGFAVLRSSIREFLCSEAMHNLGVPTTRALSLVGTGHEVLRDMFYDGHPQLEPGAIICRVAPSFLRFGSYEIFTARQEMTTLRQLADYTLRQHFPELLGTSETPGKEHYLAWFDEVCRRTCHLMVEWARVGFVHGVMNTDNMSILGLTIDYGPYGWLDNYDPEWTPNTTDAQGRRYRFGQQAQVALWNLVQLANAIYPLVEDVPALERSLENYSQSYERQYHNMMLGKLGLASAQEEDAELISELGKTLVLTETDMTLFFRHLATLNPADFDEKPDSAALIATVEEAFYDPNLPISVHQAVADWLNRYLLRLRQESKSQEQRRQRMNAVNPCYVLRNYLAQQAIDKAEQGDYSGVHELMEVLQAPYTEQPGKEHLKEKRPDWARHRAGCSMLSCSS